MTRTIRALTVVLTLAALGLAACSDSTDTDETKRDDGGTITEGGDLSTFKIEVGDCFNVDPEAKELATVKAVPCDQPHVHEAYFTFDLTGDDYPGDEAVQAEADTRCQEGFEPYVGVDYQSSELYYFVLRPTAETWKEQDDREVICTLLNEDQSPRTGSAQGARV